MVYWHIIQADHDSYFINYKYDATGICGFDLVNMDGSSYNTEYFHYAKDLLGNVKYILDNDGNIVVEYTYFHTTDDVWNDTQSMRGVGSKGMWRINKAFLRQQINAGAHFTLVDPASGYFYAKEVAYVMKYGIYVFL